MNDPAPKLISVDIETTGLDPTRHEAWEIALVPMEQDTDLTPWHFHMPVTLVGAENRALEIGDFLKRYEAPPHGIARELVTKQSIHVGDAVRAIQQRLSGNRLMGAAVHFDASFLRELFRRHGFEDPQPWHHRHFDLGSFAAGVLDQPEPMKSAQMQQVVPNEQAHTAFGDAQWNIEMYKYLLTKQGRWREG